MDLSIQELRILYRALDSHLYVLDTLHIKKASAKDESAITRELHNRLQPFIEAIKDAEHYDKRQ